MFAVVRLSGLKGVDGATLSEATASSSQVSATVSKIVSLGKSNVPNVDLRDPNIETVLKAMAVNPSGAAMRYTIGARAIVPVSDIVSNINAVKLDPKKLRLSELASMLICVAAE